MVSHFRVSAKEPKQASSPPRGWNSYDSFSWTISQEEFLQSAEIISERLLPHKYKVWRLWMSIIHFLFDWFSGIKIDDFIK